MVWGNIWHFLHNRKPGSETVAMERSHFNKFWRIFFFKLCCLIQSCTALWYISWYTSKSVIFVSAEIYAQWKKTKQSLSSAVFCFNWILLISVLSRVPIFVFVSRVFVFLFFFPPLFCGLWSALTRKKFYKYVCFVGGINFFFCHHYYHADLHLVTSVAVDFESSSYPC